MKLEGHFYICNTNQNFTPYVLPNLEQLNHYNTIIYNFFLRLLIYYRDGIALKILYLLSWLVISKLVILFVLPIHIVLSFSVSNSKNMILNSGMHLVLCKRIVTKTVIISSWVFPVISCYLNFLLG